MSKNYYFIGIGGIGMSGLALILLNRGDKVMGSDPQSKVETERLKSLGATIFKGQTAENLNGLMVDQVIVTAAIHDDNPELIEVRRRNLPVVSRAQFLGQLMSEATGPRIAVTGTHGKTTTTAMLTQILMDAGKDPTSLIGGAYSPIGGNVRAGNSGVFLTEACEAYDSFLSLSPDIAVITNVEADHLDHYGDEAGVFEGFRKFVAGMNPDGTLVVNADDLGVTRLLELIEDGFPNRRILCGTSYREGLDVWCSDLVADGTQWHFNVHSKLEGIATDIGHVRLNATGLHNVGNAMVAVGASLVMNVDFLSIQSGLTKFASTGRRFETLGEVRNALVIDDYAHHPTEIRATVSAAKSAYPGRRIVAVFQPHLYSRTRDFLDEFARELSVADVIILTDIYAAREEPLEGVRVSNIVRKIAELNPKVSVMLVPDKFDIPETLNWVVHEDDIVLIMGAGDIRVAGELFVKGYQ